MAIYALGWDDEPKGYIAELRKKLAVFKIYLTIEPNLDHFLKKLEDQKDQKWDFVIADLVQGDARALGEPDRRVGVKIAEIANGRRLPTFIITQQYKRVDPKKHGIPKYAYLKSKSTYPTWMAADIRDDLKRLGILRGRDHIFLVYGRDRKAPDATKVVRHHLKKCKAKVHMVTPGTADNLHVDLLKLMKRCYAVVAVCTPDDEAIDEQGVRIFQPRQNVLLEMGMARGMGRPLIILQKVGDKPEDHATLPSDLGGVLTIQFRDKIKDVYEKLDERLEQIGFRPD
jgi:hypothetical protein